MSSKRSFWSAILRYSISLLSTFCAASIVFLLRSLQVRVPAVAIFLNAIGISAWYGGTGPGILAAVLSLLALNAYVHPLGNWFHVGIYNVPYFCVFLGTGLLLHKFSSSVQKQLASHTAELTRMNAELMRINQEYESIFNNVEVGVSLSDPEDSGRTIRRCNRKYEELLGAAPGQLKGETAPLPESEKEAWEGLLHLLRARQPITNFQTRRVRLDGTEFSARISVSPLWSPSGACNGFVELIIDNTEQLRAEEELRRQDLYISEGQAISHTGSWAWNESRQEGFWSPELYHILGLELGSLRPGPTDYLDRTPPDDREVLEQTWNTAQQNRTNFDVLHKIARPDGSIRHVRVLGRPFQNGREELEFVGSIVDVTEQHKDRCQLEKSLFENQRLLEENIILREQSQQVAETLRDETAALQRSQFEKIIGSSAALLRTLDMVKQVAPTDTTVLLRGETGTGKELIAKAIHQNSSRANRLFHKFDCSAFPSSLVAAELFGAEKGAYTGLDRRRVGHVEVADGGTLFIDEVGELPLEAQQHLLRLLQDRVIERLGSTTSIPVNVRIIAATNRDLKAAIQDGTFRSDLYYRLNVFPIHVPPLRDRKEDIPELVQRFLREFAAKHAKPVSGVTSRDLTLLASHDWPGNIRELQNVIERAVITSSGGQLALDAETFLDESGNPDMPMGPLRNERNKLARMMIESALTACEGHVDGDRGAAKMLGFSPSGLRAQIHRLNIDRDKFKH